MERTNVTDKGYSYGGKDYIYEKRKDANGAEYQVDVEVKKPAGGSDKTYVSPSVYQSNGQYYDKNGTNLPGYSPAFQTTTQSVRNDQKNLSYINSLTSGQANGQMPQNGATVQTDANGAPIQPQKYTTPNGSTEISEAPPAGGYEYETPPTLEEGEKLGYDTNGRRYIIDKDGKVKNDAIGDQEYKANEQSIKDKNELRSLYESNKVNLDNTHKMLLDNLQKQYDQAKVKAKELGEKYLALRQTQGFESGMARYMAGVNTGILEQQEKTNLETMTDLDVKYNELIAKAVSAQNSEDLKAVNDLAAAIKKVSEEKQQAVQEAYKNSVAFTKALRDQEKEMVAMEKTRFEENAKRIVNAAPSLLRGYDSAPESKKEKFLQDYADKFGMSTDEVYGAIEKYRLSSQKEQASINATNRSNRGKGSGSSTTDEFGDPTDETASPEETARIKAKMDFFGDVDKMIASEFKNSKGVPIVVNGYLSYALFKELLGDAVSQGITREEFLNRYQNRLNLSTFSRAKSGYGLTDSEYTALKKAN